MKKLLRGAALLAALACGTASAAVLYVDPVNPGATDSGAGDSGDRVRGSYRLLRTLPREVIRSGAELFSAPGPLFI